MPLEPAVILCMIVTMVPAAREQATPIGVFSFVSAGGVSLDLRLRSRASHRSP
ncbi:MAG: hypothetical protein M3408_06415 [Actinomycetota bacterium]|jgi:hypothetical protein|nr:hypothetical protein [Pseudonocardiales bacterium]MDQ3600865.1 hypothetical protein [Actinomycetota bacterium]